MLRILLVFLESGPVQVIRGLILFSRFLIIDKVIKRKDGKSSVIYYVEVADNLWLWYLI